MLKSPASQALSLILEGAFALEHVLDPLDDGFSPTDMAAIFTNLTHENTLDQIVEGAAALRKIGTLGDMTISELIEVLKPYVPNL